MYIEFFAFNIDNPAFLCYHKIKRGDKMFWRKVFGDIMFEKVQKYAKDRNFTISTLVRLAVEQYIKADR